MTTFSTPTPSTRDAAHAYRPPPASSTQHHMDDSKTLRTHPPAGLRSRPTVKSRHAVRKLIFSFLSAQAAYVAYRKDLQSFEMYVCGAVRDSIQIRRHTGNHHSMSSSLHRTIQIMR